MKKKILSFLFFFASLLLSCSEHSHTDTEDHTAHTHEINGYYTCPMHPDIRLSEKGACPICNMELIFTTFLQKEYALILDIEPKSIAEKQAGTILLTPTILDKELEKSTLSIVHEKKMHVIVVSEDLSSFQHVHPLERQDSTLMLNILPPKEMLHEVLHENEIIFSKAGKYVFFADYVPTGAPAQLDRHEIIVAGQASPNIALVPHFKHISPLFLTELMPLDFQTACPASLIFSIFTQENQQKGALANPNEFDNYLGEKAHVVVIDQSTEKYIHAHPQVEEGKIKAPVLFSKPGLYKIWLQFQVNGQLTIQDFVINVQEEGEKSYICPMNCEHKTYNCPGFCPVCKMELAPTK